VTPNLSFPSRPKYAGSRAMIGTVVDAGTKKNRSKYGAKCRVLNWGWNQLPCWILSLLTTMPERDYHLAQADRHIAETKQLIARQRELVAVLKLIKQPTGAAISMLKALQKGLDAFEQHRQLVLELSSARRPKRHPFNADSPPSGARRPRDTIASPSIAVE
jgi:hypothetical protein